MLDKMILKYYDDIFCYCYHQLGNREAAEDICQDTFVSFIEHETEYHAYGKLKNYLYTIARNKCIDYFRKATPIYVDEIPDKGQESFEKEIEMRHLVATLPEEYRQVIILRFFQDLKYKDIAEILGTNASNVKYKVKKALKMMESEVERSEE